MADIPGYQKFTSVFRIWFYYTDTRQVTIRLRWYAVLRAIVSVLRAIVSVLLLGYIIGERLIINKGYAVYIPDGQSGIFTKIEGHNIANLSATEMDKISKEEYEKVKNEYNKFSDTNDDYYHEGSKYIFIKLNPDTLLRRLI